MGLSWVSHNTLIYTSELILCSTICVHSATRHNIHNFEAPLRCDVTYTTRLQLTNLLPISYWHEFLDKVFFYKAVSNLVFIDSEALAVTRPLTRPTGSLSSSAITYIPNRSRTVTYSGTLL